MQWWPFLAMAAAVEVLALAGVLPTWPGIAQEVALPPLDLTADLRVLLSRATSPPIFAVGLFIAVVARAALLAWILGSVRRRFRLALRFYLLALVPAYLGAALLDAGQTTLYALLFWAGVVVAVVSFLILAAVPWRAGGSLLHRLGAGVTDGMRVPTVVVYLVALLAVCGLARPGGGAPELGAVAVSAGLTFVTARVLARPGARPLPFRVAGTVVVVLILLVSRLGGGGSSPARPVAAKRSGSLLLVPGIDTSSGHGRLFRLDPQTLGFSCAQTFYFSYRGLGSGARRGEARCPLTTGAPYARADTERPLSELVAAFDAQVDALPAPVTVITHSSSSAIVWAALASTSSTSVRHLVMLTPMADPLGYPRPGRSGPNVVGAAGARLATAIGRRIHFSTFRLDAPLATELLGSPRVLERVYERRLPAGAQALAVVAALDVPLFATSHPLPRAAEVCPSQGGHSVVVTDPKTAAVMRAFLDGRASTPCRPWWTWAGLVSAGFRAPGP